MRITEEKIDIEYERTKNFFKNRAEKFKENNPYAVTMYQDNNKKLVEERNKKEIEKLYPLLKLTKESKVLDVACGIGRWADAIQDDIKEYCGVDFSGELIEIATKRNERTNFYFFEGAAVDIQKVLDTKGMGKYNTILLIGILIYLNDNDIEAVLRQVEAVCDQKSVICVREPVGLVDRLTLKNFYSEELQDDYNAIYRTREELYKYFEKIFLTNGFQITAQGFLFEEDSLNNRKETAQYYYIFER